MTRILVIPIRGPLGRRLSLATMVHRKLLSRLHKEDLTLVQLQVFILSEELENNNKNNNNNNKTS